MLMISSNEQGAVGGLAISFGLSIFLLMVAIAFGGWAFVSRQDYKDNADQKISAAVTVAKQQEASAKDKQFQEDEKQPLKTYQGPEAYGSLVLSYPKTWSGYVIDTAGQGSTLEGYFAPGVVPSTADPNAIFAVRVQVLNQPYEQVAKAAAASQASSDGKTPPPVITAYALPKLPKVVGIKIVGKLPNQKQGAMVIFPLRAQTVQIWAETSQFTADFETNILPNFSFIP